MKGGKAIASGSYGCVFKPALLCKGDTERKKDYITKVMYHSYADLELKEILVPREAIFGKYLHKPIVLSDDETINIGTEINSEIVEKILIEGKNKILISNTNAINKGGYLLQTILNDKNNTKEDAITDIYKILRQ